MKKLTLTLALFIQSVNATAQDCKPSHSNTLGNNWKHGAMHKVDIGEGLLISGRILSAHDCKPIANARIEHWQSSPDGEYYDKHRAYMFSNKNGAYKFNTVWPGLRHIHFIISAEGHEDLSTHWRWKKFDSKTDKAEFDIVLTKLPQP